MRIVFNFGDESEKMHLGEKITFDKLDFITGVEEVVDRGLLTIAHHLARHDKLLAKPGREHDLGATLYLRTIRDPVPTKDLIPDGALSRSSREPTNTAMTHQI